jgi:hypothetical protein
MDRSFNDSIDQLMYICMLYLFLFLEQSNERGGDSDLLTIHPPEIASTTSYPTSTTSTALNESSDVTSGVIAASTNSGSERLKSSFYEVVQNYFFPLFGLNTKDHYNSYHHSHQNHQNMYPDHNHPSRKYLQATSSLYSDADMTRDSKSSRNIFSEAFQKSLFEVWLKLPQSDDHMVELDAFTVIALFENIGVILSYNTALHCLNHIRDSINALNRYGFKDVLKWYQLYGVDMSNNNDDNDDDDSRDEVYKSSSHGNRKGNAWLSYKHYLKSIYDLIHNIYQRSIDFMKYQYSVLEKIDMLDRQHILKYYNYMKPKSMNGNQGGTVVVLQDSNYLTKLLDFQNQSRVKPSIVQCTYYFNHPEITIVKTLSTNILAAATAVSSRAVTSKNGSGGRVGSPDRSGSRNNSSRKPLSSKNNEEDDEDDEDNYNSKHHGNEDDDDDNRRMNGGDNRAKTPGTANRAFREENDPYVYEHEGEIADDDDDDDDDDEPTMFNHNHALLDL